MFTATRKLAALATATAIAAGAFATPSFAYERWLDIENDGSSRITGVYVTHKDYGGWGYNLIDASIRVGDVDRVEPAWNDGYCKFDIKMVFADGSETFAWNVNLCEATYMVADEYSYDVYYI